MENLTNMFFNDQFIEMTKKNMEFTMELFKTNTKNSQEFMKGKVNEYFKYINSNIEFLNENYEKAVASNDEIAQLYKENIEKIYNEVKGLMEKLKNNQ